jgi:hypothetical protein
MPIAKNNDPATLSDYRPISILLAALSKAMEIIDRSKLLAGKNWHDKSVSIWVLG